jgi:hypothetical protein
MLTRRSLLGGLVAFVAAPAIVRAASLMPVKAWGDPLQLVTNPWWIGHAPPGVPTDLFKEMQILADLMCKQAGIQPILMGGNF